MSHLQRRTRIHAPIEEVYAMAEDPRHWDDWYVGQSPEEEIKSTATARMSGAARSITVGMAFPLTQRVLEDHFEATRACWRAETNGDAAFSQVSAGHELLMLAGEHTWSYRTIGSDTEVTVDVEFEIPSRLAKDPADREKVEQLEAWCLEQSLRNLQRLCETT